jgi:hypothetical protein
VRFTTKDLLAEAAAALRCSPGDIAETITRIGRGLGPPWAKDQRDAATAGWYALSRAASA